MSRLLIKFPTRNRPEKFKAAFDRYVSFLSGRHQVRFVISLDEDDDSMNNDGMRAWLDSRAQITDLRYRYGQSRTKIEAINRDLEGEDGDVLLVASDDMNPVRKKYDAVIFEAFARVFPDFDGAVRFWDGQRRQTDALMTLAVMGFPLYRRLGYIYYPQYASVYADTDQTAVCLKLKRLALSPECIIRHEWTHELFDALHARNNCDAMYESDHAVFVARKAREFDMDTKFGPDAIRPGPPPMRALMDRQKLRRIWRALGFVR